MKIKILKKIFEYGNENVKKYIYNSINVLCNYEKKTKDEILLNKDIYNQKFIKDIISPEFDNEINIIKNMTTNTDYKIKKEQDMNELNENNENLNEQNENEGGLEEDQYIEHQELEGNENGNIPEEYYNNGEEMMENQEMENNNNGEEMMENQETDNNNNGEELMENQEMEYNNNGEEMMENQDEMEYNNNGEELGEEHNDYNNIDGEGGEEEEQIDSGNMEG